MTNDTITATITIPAAADAVFGVLADPAMHAAIDGTGWVRDSLDGKTLTGDGQIFRLRMYTAHPPRQELRDGQQGGRVRPPPRDRLATGPRRCTRWEPFIRRLDLALRHRRRRIR